MSKRRTFANVVDVNVRDFEITEAELSAEPIDTFGELVPRFIAHVVAKNAAPSTVKYYRTKLFLWRDRIESIGVSSDVRNITVETIERFIADHTQVRGLKYSSALTTLRAVKAFANYLKNIAKVIDSHGFDDFVLAKSEPPLVRTFNEAEILQMLGQTNPKLFVGIRDYTIMLTFLETGIRLRELCDIKLGDVDFDDRLIKIWGKDQKFRYVPFQRPYAKVLRQYLKVRGKSVSDTLFITHDDEPIRGRSIQDALKKYGKGANISSDIRVSPHTFRHTFAKMYVQNGGDPFSLQKILGHATMDMVRVYVNMFGKELDEAHRKFSPLQRILR